MIALSDIEIDVAKEILNIGISKSADALSHFTKSKVLARTFDFRIESSKDITLFFKKDNDQKMYLLSTELKGELTGDCFLVFQEHEVDAILAANFPGMVLDNPADKEEMSSAVLLELDNIVSASVITQLSNILQCDVHGHVPFLNIVMGSQLGEVLKEKVKEEYFFCFKVAFNTENSNINPEFIWGLNQRFIEGVKEIAKDGKDRLDKYKIA